MNELSERLRQAVDFLKRNGYAKKDIDVARRIGLPKSTMCMNLNGTRLPTLEQLAKFCDAYPIDFKWICTGAGGMVKDERELSLLRRIDALERELKQLKE